ncbi:MAG: aldehyde ferredoxin oxidoreductase family protein [Candidatus Bathyarchaeia archaeon]
MIGVYNGRVLRVDLNDSKFSVENVDHSVFKNFLGGVGLAAKVMIDEVNPKVEPFAPENYLIFAPGALTGSSIPAGNKSVFVTKSPLTNAWGEATFSGVCGINLKRAGFDGLIIKGKAERPLYLFISDDTFELRDATKIWNMETFDACTAIKKELDLKEVGIACIGPAGEKLVRIASIISDDGRAAGRCGVGAVMGSKNLKAIAIHGTGEIEVADKKRFDEVKRAMLKVIAEKKPLQFGTAGSVEAFNEMGNLPTKNWTLGVFSGAKNISGQFITERFSPRKRACFACPVACGREIELKEGPYAPLKCYGPEYETVAALGSLCMNDKIESIIKANDICNRLGVDTISTGAAIAFAMECFEKGLLAGADTGGLEVKWGDPEVIVRLCELIGRKEGFGTLLGEGVKVASKVIGRNSDRFALHVKGLELPMHSPYRFKEMGLAYAVSNRGACHNRGSPAYVSRGILIPEFGYTEKTDGFTTQSKAKLTADHQDICTMIDALGICKFIVFFGGISVTMLAEAYSAAIGWHVEPSEMKKTGARIWFLQRIFNYNAGLRRNDDTLPERFLKEPLKEGAAANQTVDLETMLNEYYEIRGLDNTDGKPKISKIKELALDFVIPKIST